MMTKEEYQENVIRLWDSLRTEHKGEKDCAGVGCSDCPLDNEVGICNIYKSIEIVENWAKEHPIKTNADKFKEVFGVERLPLYSCDTNAKCEDCGYYTGSGCNANHMFWNAEYKGKTEGCEEE